MSYYNDASVDHTRWSPLKLIQEIRRVANMERMAVNFSREERDRLTAAGKINGGMFGDMDSNAIRRVTQLYRDTWLNPLIDEMERRLTR